MPRVRRLQLREQSGADVRRERIAFMQNCAPSGGEVALRAVVDLAEERLEDKLVQHYC